jgi:hypothetical protein
MQEGAEGRGDVTVDVDGGGALSVLPGVERHRHCVGAVQARPAQHVRVLDGLGQDLHQTGQDNDVLAQWEEVFTPDAAIDVSAVGGPSAMTLREEPP